MNNSKWTIKKILELKTKGKLEIEPVEIDFSTESNTEIVETILKLLEFNFSIVGYSDRKSNFKLVKGVKPLVYVLEGFKKIGQNIYIENMIEQKEVNITFDHLEKNTEIVERFF